jgi:nucleoid-associated protein YgaU
LPTIDEVRVGVDGILVIAGRAAPGSTVSVLVDGVEVASATADGSGAFAAVGSAAPSETARVLSLRATGADEVLSSLDEVILAPVSVQADPVETVAVTAPAVTPQTAESGSVGAAGAPAPAPEVVGTPEAEAEAVASAPQTTDVPQPPETAETQAAPTVSAENETEEVAEATPAPAETEPAAANGPQASVAVSEPEAPQVASPSDPQPQQGVAVLKSTAEGVTLVPQSPQVLDRIALDTIGYSDAGDVRLSGRTSLAASAVRVYLNNRAVVTLPVDESGGWRGNLPDVDAGIYTLRVDAVDAGGQVTSRVETPFKREAKDVLAAASAGQTGPVAAVTVQTGDTLWAIARDRYGEGLLYVKVFEANRTSIRDPDLIYPGQVFDLPVE